MRAFQAALLPVGQVLVLLTLAGLWWRRRLHRVWLLPVYLSVAALAQTVALVAPEVLRVWRRWAVLELLLRSLTLGIVAEIAWRVFANLPHGRQRAWRWLAPALLLCFGLLLLVPWHEGEHSHASWLYVMVTEILPRLSYGAGFVCLALGYAIRTSGLPFDKLHAPVVLGLGGYLFLYAVSLGLQQDDGPRALAYVVTPLAYTLMMGWWAWAAWRHEKLDPHASKRARQRLQPWLD